MKKRMFVYYLIVTACLFHLLVPNVVFGQAAQVFNKYKETFKHPDVHTYFPDVLNAFKDPEIQQFLTSALISRFAGTPRSVRDLYAETDDSILCLLLLDHQFGELFRDDQFHAVVRSSTQIDELVRLIRTLEPRAREECPVLRSVPTTLAIVSGYGQKGPPETPLQDPFVVEVRDQYGDPLSGENVTFKVREGKGSGSLSPTMPRPNNLGQYQTYLTLGSSAGEIWVDASVGDIALPQTFTATTLEERRATTLTYIGTVQTGPPNTALKQFTVQVKDQYNKPFSSDDVLVTFKIVKDFVTFEIVEDDGEGGLSEVNTANQGEAQSLKKEIKIKPNSDGLALVTLTFGSRVGVYYVAAAIKGNLLLQTFFVAIAVDESSGPGAPSVHALVQGDISAADVQVLLTQAKALPETIQADPAHQHRIAVLEQLLATLTEVPVVPKQTALLLNYPNPFNPETWIPYQLSEAADVTLSIYSVEGNLVRTLMLGHQTAGVYKSKSQTAYWDGRNEFGEPVASGLYFYTLTAGDFTATRKMLIRK